MLTLSTYHAFVRHLEGASAWNLCICVRVLVSIGDQVAVKVIRQIGFGDSVAQGKCVRNTFGDGFLDCRVMQIYLC